MKNVKDIAWDFIEILVIGTLIVGLTFWFVGQPVLVSGSSMNPTLKNKQQLVSEKLTYKLREPEREEIVIIKHPNKPSRLVIKRIIGMPGDNFEIKNGFVYINGSKLNEKYLETSIITNGKNKLIENKAVKIPEDKYIALGDNRADSMDSRNWGFVDEGQIVGKATLVYVPFSEFKILQ